MFLLGSFLITNPHPSFLSIINVTTLSVAAQAERAHSRQRQRAAQSRAAHAHAHTQTQRAAEKPRGILPSARPNNSDLPVAAQVSCQTFPEKLQDIYTQDYSGNYL